MSKLIFEVSGSSSAAVHAAVLRKSPKSENMKLGITVSKSMTHNTLPSLSKRMLFTFVSQWQMRFGRTPSRNICSALHISMLFSSISSIMAITSSLWSGSLSIGCLPSPSSGSSILQNLSFSTASMSWLILNSML